MTTGKFVFTAGTGKVIDADGNVSDKDDTAVFASTAATDITVTPSDLPENVAVSSYQWYVKEGAAGTPLAVSGATGKQRKLTLAHADNDVSTGTGAAAGNIYYVVVTGSNEIEYKSGTVTLVAPEATSLDVTSMTAEYGTALAASNVAKVKDQFGEDLTGTYTYSLSGTGVTASSYSASSSQPGVSLSGASSTVTTLETTAADEYKINVYELANGADVSADKLIGTITLKVEALAVAYTSSASTNNVAITATKVADGAGNNSATFTVSDGAVNKTIAGADIKSIKVYTGTDFADEVTGTVTGLAWVDDSADTAAADMKVVIEFQGNFKGTVTGYIKSTDSDAQALRLVSVNGSDPA